MKNMTMTIENDKNEKRIYSIFEDVEKIKNEMGEEAKAIAFDNLLFATAGSYELDEVESAVSNMAALANMVGVTEVDRLATALNFNELALIDIEKCLVISKDLSDKELVYEYINFEYGFDISELDDELEELLSQNIRFSAMKNTILTYSKVVKLDIGYIFLSLKDDIITFW